MNQTGTVSTTLPLTGMFLAEKWAQFLEIDLKTLKRNVKTAGTLSQEPTNAVKQVATNGRPRASVAVSV